MKTTFRFFSSEAIRCGRLSVAAKGFMLEGGDVYWALWIWWNFCEDGELRRLEGLFI